MDSELFSALEQRIETLLSGYVALKQENARLTEENRRFLSEREGLKGRIDAILSRIEAV